MVEVASSGVEDVREALKKFSRQLSEQAEAGKNEYCLSLDND